MTYLSVHTQASILRYFLRDLKHAKDKLQGRSFLSPAEECLALIYEDLDGATNKATAALALLDALLDEMEEGAEEEETADRYTLIRE